MCFVYFSVDSANERYVKITIRFSMCISSRQNVWCLFIFCGFAVLRSLLVDLLMPFVYDFFFFFFSLPKHTHTQASCFCHTLSLSRSCKFRWSISPGYTDTQSFLWFIFFFSSGRSKQQLMLLCYFLRCIDSPL